MIRQIFTATCVECGEECCYNEMLCENCVDALPLIKLRCRGCGHPVPVDTHYCKHCEDKKSGIDYYYADYIYTGALKSMVLHIKYHWAFRGASQLGALCRAYDVVPGNYDMVVPVPFHFRRRFSRFLQPVSLVAADLADMTEVPLVKALLRTVHTEFQSRLSRKERLNNVKNVFEACVDVKGKRVLLVDDIVTTGATVLSAAGALKKAKAASVDVYSLMAGIQR